MHSPVWEILLDSYAACKFSREFTGSSEGQILLLAKGVFVAPLWCMKGVGRVYAWCMLGVGLVYADKCVNY